MDEFKTPQIKRARLSALQSNSPLRVPASPELLPIHQGDGISIYNFPRSGRIGPVKSPWVVKKSNADEDDLLKHYNRNVDYEASILRGLDHPNIIGFRATASGLSGESCLAMEKLHISLGDLIEGMVTAGKTSFPLKDIETIALKIANGLKYLHHTKKLLHGDLKSYNIVLNPDLKTVKICDFGLSLKLNEQLHFAPDKKHYLRKYYGSDHWNAPEVMKNTGPVTNKTDIWAFGLVIFEMLTLSIPYFKCTSPNPLLPSWSQNALDVNKSFRFYKTCGKFPCEHLKSNPEDFGTRPKLPAREFKGYKEALEIFSRCTELNQDERPSARRLVRVLDFLKV